MYDDALYYIDIANSINSISDIYDWVDNNIISIRLPAIGFHFFNIIFLRIFDYSPWVLSYAYLIFYWTIISWLSRIEEIRFLPRCFFIILFLSPSVLWLSLPLLKDVLSISLVMLSVGFIFKNKYKLVFFLILLMTLVRVYSFLALISIILSIYYYKINLNNKNKNYFRMLAYGFSLILIISILIVGRSTPNLNELFISYIAILLTPIPWHFENFISSNLVFIQMVESIIILFSIVIIFYYLMIRLLKLKLSSKIIIITLDFFIILFPVVFILASEATQILEAIQYSGGAALSAGEQYNRKKIIIIPVIYIYFLLIFEYIFIKYKNNR
jgi:hypothetical protein